MGSGKRREGGGSLLRYEYNFETVRPDLNSYMRTCII